MGPIEIVACGFVGGSLCSLVEWLRDRKSQRTEAIDFAVAELRTQATHADGKTVSTTLYGWAFSLSHSPVDSRYRLAARLDPPGRSSTEADWRRFGYLLAKFGVPREMAESVRGARDPNGWFRFTY